MIINKIKLSLFQRRWRKKNQHNQTTVTNLFAIDLINVGNMTYGPLEIHSWGAANEELTIGNFVSIASGVKFLLGGNHRYDTFSTYPFKVKFLGASREAWSKGGILIEDDVWIGTDAMIMSGVKVGKGAVIAARSVITKDVPPYAIVGGNPAKIIKYRFNDEIQSYIKDFKFKNIDQSFIDNNINELYQTLDENILSKILKS